MAIVLLKDYLRQKYSFKFTNLNEYLKVQLIVYKTIQAGKLFQAVTAALRNKNNLLLFDFSNFNPLSVPICGRKEM